MKQTKVSRFGKIAVGIGVVAAAAGSIATLNVSAHHAFGAEFDPNRPLILRGPVTKVEWVNPHAWIHLEHTNEDGEKESWMVEGGTPNTLLRRGLNKRSLTPGTYIMLMDTSQKTAQTELTVEMSPWLTDAKSLWVHQAPVLRETDATQQSVTISVVT